MRILGIDPGSRITGLGVVETCGAELRMIKSECIRPSKNEIAARLVEIYQGVTHIITEYNPEAVAIEQVFFAKNARSALILGQASGSAVCAAAIAGLSVTEYSALQIKQAVVGTGKASKQQVQHMVSALLNLSAATNAALNSDMADALACAICHIHTRQGQTKLTQRRN